MSKQNYKIYSGNNIEEIKEYASSFMRNIDSQSYSDKCMMVLILANYISGICGFDFHNPNISKIEECYDGKPEFVGIATRVIGTRMSIIRNPISESARMCVQRLFDNSVEEFLRNEGLLVGDITNKFLEAADKMG